DQLRARATRHRAALRQLGNRLVGLLHGCLKKTIQYHEDVAWAQQQTDQGVSSRNGGNRTLSLYFPRCRTKEQAPPRQEADQRACDLREACGSVAHTSY